MIIESTLKFSFPKFEIKIEKGRNVLKNPPEEFLKKIQIYLESGHMTIMREPAKVAAPPPKKAAPASEPPEYLGPGSDDEVYEPTEKDLADVADTEPPPPDENEAPKPAKAKKKR